MLLYSWKGNLFWGSLFLHRLFAHKFGADLCFCKRGLDSSDPRAATLELMAHEIYYYKIEGAVAELGVYKGNFAKLINHYFPDRKLYLFDTFDGFDSRDVDVERKNSFSSATEIFSKTSVDSILNIMEHKKNCIIKKGWFPETAEGIEDSFCFVSLDADLYKPTNAGLEFFYPRLVRGG